MAVHMARVVYNIIFSFKYSTQRLYRIRAGLRVNWPSTHFFADTRHRAPFLVKKKSCLIHNQRTAETVTASDLKFPG